MHPLDHMLAPASVAIVGASSRGGSVGHQTVRQLLLGGFGGRIHLVNPGHSEIEGHPVRRSLEDVDERVDLAVLAVANHRLEDEMEKAVRMGARSVTIFASCNGVARDGAPLGRRLTELAGEAGIPICGGNGMGFVNLYDRVRVTGFHQPPDLVPGGVTFLSHSGSLFSAMLHNHRRISFDLVVSTGLELNTTMDRYLDWALDRPQTRVVALFMETVRHPSGLRAALGRAEAKGIPVVALKVGASRRGQAAVATHSGAIAGEDAVFEALFDHHGIHRVATMDEMADTIELLCAGRAATAEGLGAVHDSGGERALLIDTADRVGVSLPAIGERTARRLEKLLDPGLEPANPVDAWGTGRDAATSLTGCLEALADDDSIGAVALCVDLTAEEEIEDAYSRAAIQAHRATTKPLLVIANLSSTVDPAQATVLRDAGVPVLEGTETALRAVRHLLDRHARSKWPDPDARLTPSAGLETAPRGEEGALAILGRYGIATPATAIVGDEEEAVAAADRIGYPVVLKATGVDHKTEVDGVRVGLGDGDALSSAYRYLSSRLGPRLMVSAEVTGVELAVGMVSDPQFGPVVVLSGGGTLIEVLSDRVALLPPVDAFQAERAIDRLASRRLLAGHRGSPPADVEAFAALVARFSELAVDAAGVISSIDLNPVMVGPDQAIAVDVLMVGHG